MKNPLLPITFFFFSSPPYIPLFSPLFSSTIITHHHVSCTLPSTPPNNVRPPPLFFIPDIHHPFIPLYGANIFPYIHSRHGQNPQIPLYVALAILALVLAGFGISRWIWWASPAPAEPEAPLQAEEGSSEAPAVLVQVGEDEFGYMLADILKENNVNNEGMRFDPGARTALAFVTLRSDGEREFMFYRNPSADMLLQEDELDLDLINQKGKNLPLWFYKSSTPPSGTKAWLLLLYGSISLITEPCRSAHIAAAKAEDAGVVLSYDPNLRLRLWPSADSAREGILSIWETADIIKEFNGSVKGLKVDAVDTTGAGDAFVAGILSQLAEDLSLLQNEEKLRDSLKFANVCGALTVTERGAIPDLPTKEAVLNALLKPVS